MDFSFINSKIPKKGDVLLSDPFSQNNYFGRSVVYICEHNDDGTFGFVLNNFIPFEFSRANNFPQIDTKVSLGGPVQKDNLYFIHTLGEHLSESIPVANGISMGGNYNELISKIEHQLISLDQVRFFLGYSGWSPGQLQEEINRKSWIVASVNTPKDVMDITAPHLWENFMKREGAKFEVLAKAPLHFYDN